eukprot:TRINITY_DN2760_c0_g1_i1.p1 TRINITY_DN2760_c0_g1~~TRINITY_DN2760_c0_g1_i1.p1  ORF type:complete len:443 (+),score=51.01 TRINITY_DN2760_c0_g1_i1:138-1466(+)
MVSCNRFFVLMLTLAMAAGCPPHSMFDGESCICTAAFPFCAGTACSPSSRPTMSFASNCQDCSCHHALLASTMDEHELFDRYAILHNLIRSGKLPERALVYTCQDFCGGTGDRLRGIITAFYLSILTNRAFFLHSTIPQPMEAFFTSNYINWSWPRHWRPPFTTLNFMSGQSPMQLVERMLELDRVPLLALRTNEYAVPVLFHWRRNFTSTIAQWRLGTGPTRFEQASRHWGYDPALISSPRLQLLAKDVGLADLSSPFKNAFERLLTPTALLTQQLDLLASKHGWDRATQPHITVHLRTGLEFADDPNRMQLEVIDKAFDCVMQHTQAIPNNQHLRWHLATDAKAVYERFQARFKRQAWEPSRLISIYSLDGVVPVHVDRYGANRAEAKANEVFVHVDYVLLTQAIGVFASTSTFSRTGAAAGGHESVILVPACKHDPILY